MAKRATKVAKPTARKTGTNLTRRSDAKYLRKEVLDFKGLSPEQINVAIRDTLSFNNYMYTYKEGGEWLLEFAKKTLSPDDVKSFKAAEDWRSSMPLCTFAKMVNAGCDIGKKNMDFLTRGLSEIVAAGARKRAETTKTGTVNKTNAVLDSVLSSIDEQLDGWPNPVDVKECIGENTLSKTDRDYIISRYTGQLECAKESLADKEMREGYRFLKSPKDRKAYIERLSNVVSGLSENVVVVQRQPVVRKPRVKKAVPVEKIIKGLKYQPESREYNLKSAHPKNLVGAKMTVLFNTCTRALTILKSTEGFGVTGTTLTNLDESGCFKKTLRKPQDIIPDLMKTTKLRTEKVFSQIKTVASPGVGRLNENTIIMKVY